MFMDSFEQVVSEILWRQGYWVQRNVKVELSADEKKKIGRHSSPRWDIDVVAYRGGDNTLRVVECKSYLDSVGVRFSAFDESHIRYATDSKLYKLFSEPETRQVVFDCLRRQLAKSGACLSDAKVKLSLVCGKVKKGDHEKLRSHFQENDWDLWDEAWLRKGLAELAAGGYENQVSAIVAKLLLR
jgi:hypothetical protein